MRTPPVRSMCDCGPLTQHLDSALIGGRSSPHRPNQWGSAQVHFAARSGKSSRKLQFPGRKLCPRKGHGHGRSGEEEEGIGSVPYRQRTLDFLDGSAGRALGQSARVSGVKSKGCRAQAKCTQKTSLAEASCPSAKIGTSTSAALRGERLG